MPERPPKPEHRASSPRFKNRSKEQKVKNEKRVPDDLGPIMAELKKQSDRGAAIIAGSLMEQILEATIKARLRPMLSGQHRVLFGRMAPLSTFSAKIEIGFLIGIYSEAAYKNLNMIREVRNKFAHEFDALTFEHPDVTKLVNDPSRPRFMKLAKPSRPRDEFMAAFSVLSSLLIAMETVDIRLPSVAEVHGHALVEMGQALNQALRKQAGHPPGAPPESEEPKR